MPLRSVNIMNLENVPYDEAFFLQKKIQQECIEGIREDTLILLEHPPVFTIGRKGGEGNLLVSKEKLKQLGIELFYTNRGGDITYHGPGQIVIYPILNLNSYGRDIHRYVRNLEETIIHVLAGYSISAGRKEKYTGVWVKNEKIAAIGVAIKKWVTLHGAAFNIQPNLNHFKMIKPCGITEYGVTSLERLIDRKTPMEEIRGKITKSFAKVFGIEIKEKNCCEV